MMTDNRTNKYAAFLARQNHQRAPWRGVGVKCLCGKVFELDADHALHQVEEIMRAALEAAAGVAPQAPSEYAYCPIHGDLLAANRSYRCGNAPTGHEYAASVQPSSTVDEAALIREAKAEAWDEGYWQGINGHTGPGNPYSDCGAVEYREGSET